MKRLIHLLIQLSVLTITGFSQSNGFNLQPLGSQNLMVNEKNTASIIFPSPIVSFDRGTQDILVKKTLGNENILRVKASVATFAATSLTVVTKDGSLYSFNISYGKQLDAISYAVIPPSKLQEEDVKSAISSSPFSKLQQPASISEIMVAPATFHQRFHRMEMKAVLDAGFIFNDKIYLRVVIANNSQIPMDLQRIKILLKDRGHSKRSATQEIEIPLEIGFGDSTIIPADSTVKFLVATAKLTIQRNQFLELHFIEENGARRIILKLPGKKLLRLKSMDYLN